MCMMNRTMSAIEMEKAVNDVLAIIEAKGTKIEKTEVAEAPVGKMVTYDGHGSVIEIDGVKTHQGKKAKKSKRVKNGKDMVREALTEACEDFLKKTVAFEGKVYTNTKDGVVIRMTDADYTVKATGHATCEFEPTAEGFKASKSFATRGSAVNHASAIAKMLTAEIENQNPGASFEGIGNGNPILVCEAKASGIRVQIENSEFTIKISKKRARCIIDLD